MYIYPLPPPQLLPFTGPKWGHPGTWHEQILFFTHKGIYTQHNFALAVVDLEKKIFENYRNFNFGGPGLGPPEGQVPHFNKFRAPSPKDDSCQVSLKFSSAFSRRR